MDAKLGKNEVRKTYERMASSYDLWSNFAESKARVRCLDLAAIKNGEKVLEVAVGTGVLFEQILRLNPSGINEGIDLTEAMLARARERARRTGSSNYTLRTGDAYSLDYPEESFDVVVNNYMFDLIPQQDFITVLNEFRRVLRKGGRLVLVSMTRGSGLFNTVWDWLYRYRPALLGGCRGVELRPYLEQAGFEKINREYVSQIGFPSEVVYGVKPQQIPAA